MTQERIVCRVIVRGRVQGVGFRVWVEDEALRCGLEGWTRNRRDGRVEAVFAGPPDAVAAMIEACRHGPPSARVEAVDTKEASPLDLEARRGSEKFSLLPTV
jgi:acylphosphatase